MDEAMKTIDEFLGKAGAFYFATVDGDRPKMRVLGFRTVLDGKIYFAVGTFKDVYRQLQANPNCEVSACVGPEFVRWDGRAVFREDPRLDEAAKQVMPEVVEMYEKAGNKLAYFTIEGGHAETVDVTNQKKKLF